MPGRTHLFFENSRYQALQQLADSLGLGDNPYAVTHLMDQAMRLLYDSLIKGDPATRYEHVKTQLSTVRRNKQFMVPEGDADAFDPTLFPRMEGVTRFHCYFDEQIVRKSFQIIRSAEVLDHPFATSRVMELAAQLLLDAQERPLVDGDIKKVISDLKAILEFDLPTLYHERDRSEIEAEEAKKGDVEDVLAVTEM